MEKKFRYPGTRPFQEGDRNLFFGRNTDIKNLTELIVLEKLVVLFSKSGYGKSSLLNAGVIPRLTEKEKFEVLSVRLNEQAKNPVDLMKYHLKGKANKTSFLDSKFNIPSELPDDLPAILWFYCKSIQLSDKSSKALVLVFDQFEELFNFSNSEIEYFAGTLATLLNLNMPESVRKLLRKKLESDKSYFKEEETDRLLEPLNLKAVFSLRNDRLSLLNQLKGSLPAVFKKTYELQPLDEIEALEALLEPAEKEGDFASPMFTYSEDAISMILNSLKDKENKRIETFQLQLICQHAEELIIEKAYSDSKKLELTAAELGNPEDIFENHYNTIIGNLPRDSQHKARILIEDKLIIGGNRVPLPESVIIEEHKISADLLKTLVDKRLLRSEPNTVGGMSFELSHDTLVAPIQKTAKIRRLQEAEERAEKEQLEKARIEGKLRRTRILLGTSVFALVLAVITSFYAYRQKDIADKEKKSTELALIQVEKSQEETNSALIREQNAKKAAQDARAKIDSALMKAVEAQEVTIRALADARKAQRTTNLALNRAEETQRAMYLALNDAAKAKTETDSALKKVEEANFQFQKQAATSQALVLAANSDYLLANGQNSQAFRVAEAAYLSALEAYTYPPTPILLAISNAFYNSKSFQSSYFEGHLSAVSSVSFSSDGKFLATGSEDSTAILWDTQGKIIQKFEGHKAEVTSVAFSPDGEYLLTGSYDGTAILWDKKGNSIQEFIGHQSLVTSVAFSPDGKSILTGGYDNIAILWDIQGNRIRNFEGHQEAIFSVAFSPDGKSILTGSGDKTAILWNLQGKPIQNYKGHKDAVYSVAFSPDGKSLVTGSWDLTAILWSIQGKKIQEFEGHLSLVLSVAFSPDGKYLVTGSYDNTAILWDTQGNQIQEFDGHQDAVYSVAFSPDGKSVVTGSLDFTAIGWDIQGNQFANFFEYQGEVSSLAFSPDRLNLLTGNEDGMAILWDTNGKIIQKFEGHKGSVTSVAFSPNGKSLLTGGNDGIVILWDIDGKIIQKFEGHQDWVVTSVVFSPDGKSILTGSDDNTAILWDTQGNLLQKFEGHQYLVTSVAFSPDGKYILTGSSDETAILWDTQGNQIQKFKGHKGSVSSVAFSPDGKSILTGSEDNTAILWDTSGKVIQRFIGHKDYVTSVAFSPDGNSIITGSSDYYAILWDTQGKKILTFEGLYEKVTTVAFSPDGKAVLTGSYAGNTLLWKTPQGIYEWLQSKDCPLRQLTEEEKKRFGIVEEGD